MDVQYWVTLGASMIAVAGVLATLWQRERSEERDRRARLEFENRTEWWRRWEVAMDLARSENPLDRSIAGGTVRALAMSPLITSSELGMIEVLGEVISQNGTESGDR